MYAHTMRWTDLFDLEETPTPLPEREFRTAVTGHVTSVDTVLESVGQNALDYNRESDPTTRWALQIESRFLIGRLAAAIVNEEKNKKVLTVVSD